MSEQKKVVVILGSGRSGTSMLMSILHSLGVDVSNNLTPENPTNIKGGWEDADILKISRLVLRRFHRNGDHLSYLPMPDDWLEDSFVGEQMAKLRDIVKDHLLGADQMWGFKEPVTAKLLPMWEKIFSSLSLDPIYFLSLRNPRDVVKSFENAYDTPRAISELIWLSRYSDAILYTQGKVEVFDYDDWFSVPMEQSKKVVDHLGLQKHSLEVGLHKPETNVPDRKLSTATGSKVKLNSKLSQDLYDNLKSYSGNTSGSAVTLNLAEQVKEYLSTYIGISYSVDHLGEQLDNLNLELLKYRSPSKYLKVKRKSLTCYTKGIIAGVASYSAREDVFEKSLASILPQVDHIHVFLNGYSSTPEYLLKDKITVYRSQDYLDISATGKVFSLDKLESCYFFTVDDDILYPPNYVAKMLECIEKYKRKVCVSVHGSIFPERPKWYFERYSLFPFQRELKEDKFVSLIGSGTFAFHTDTLKTHFDDFMPKVMVDLKFSILAKEQKVPLVCIARENAWLKVINDAEGLYQEFIKSKTHHTVECMKSSPWGFSEYKDIVTPVLKSIFPSLEETDIKGLKLDGEFIQSIRDGTIPNSWKESDLYLKKTLDRKAVYDPIGTAALFRRAESELGRTKLRLEKTLESTSYRLGSALIQAFKSPGRKTLLLPIHLLRIFFRKTRSS